MTRRLSSVNSFVVAGFFGITLLLSGLMALSGCSSDSRETAGGTEAESTIALQVMLADGKPAQNARVRILPESYLSDGLTATEWQETDEEGRIEFLGLDSGSYKVEVRQVSGKKASGAVSRIDLNLGRSRDVDTLKLDELSRIEGVVPAGQGPSVARIPGLERFVVPDTAGHFVIDSLPQGDFDVIVESRSNRGSVTLAASAGDSLPEVDLGEPRGFAVENFESFSGISASGEILGDGWWYSQASDGQLVPLWEESLTKYYSGSEGCASGGCVRMANRMGVLLGLHKTDYALPDLDTLMFSARGSGKLTVTLAYGDADSVESGFTYVVTLSKVWQGFAVPVDHMKPYGKAKDASEKANRIVSRVDFQVTSGDSVYLDDVFMGGISEQSLGDVVVSISDDSSDYSEDWSDHDTLLAGVIGYGSKVSGGDQGKICVVTSKEDKVKGSLRSCVESDEPAWIVFENSGNYQLESDLSVPSNKTIDGRGRDIRIMGGSVLVENQENVIFENLMFIGSEKSSKPGLTIGDNSRNVWVDHCEFRDYPQLDMSIEGGSSLLTVSWSRFENGTTGIHFGEVGGKDLQLTLHHNYFGNLSQSGISLRGGDLHSFNNYFNGMEYAGIECTDSSRCVVEGCMFNVSRPVENYRIYELGVPVDSTEGFSAMSENWFISEGEDKAGVVAGYKPDYKYAVDKAGTDLVWRVVNFSGIR